jgi:hypothetical protein
VLGDAIAERAERKRRDRRAKQGDRADDPDAQVAEAEREQVRRKQHRYVAVAERAQRARDENPRGAGFDAARDDERRRGAADHFPQ